MSWRDAPLYVETFDLAEWLLRRLARMEGQSVLSNRAAANALVLVESVALALTFPQRRERYLVRADETVVRLRMQLRLAHRIGGFSARRLRFGCGRLAAIGSMIGGWQRRVRRKKDTDQTDHKRIEIREAGHHR